ncbi:hypothetical protein DIPPA_13206 [Diplonema papillatum]|nr:hypothetical protein DIPPA_13206 [Diplonema papillatum]
MPSNNTAMPSTPPPDTAMPSNNTAKPSTPSPDTAMPSTPSSDTAMPPTMLPTQTPAIADEDIAVAFSEHVCNNTDPCPEVRRTATVYPQIHTESCENSCAPTATPPGCWPGTVTVTPVLGTCSGNFTQMTLDFVPAAPVANCKGKYEWVTSLNYTGCLANVTFKTHYGTSSVSAVDFAPVPEKPSRISNFACPGIEEKTLRDVVTCTAVAFRYTADEVFSLAVFEDSQGVHFDGIDGSSVPSTAAQEDGYTFIFDYTLPSDPVDALRINSSVYYLSQDGSRNYSFDYYVETLSVTAPLLPVLPPTSDSIIMCTELADDRLTHVCNITCYDSIGEVRAPEESTDFEMTFMKYGCNEGPDPTLSEFYGQVKNVVYFNLTYSEICANDTIVLDLDVTVDNVTLLTRDPSTHELVAEVVKLYSNGHHAHTPTPTLPAVPEEEKSHTTIIIIFAVAGGVLAGVLALLFFRSTREKKAVGTWCVLGEGSSGKELGFASQLVEEGPSDYSVNTHKKPKPQYHEELLELAE